MSSTLFKTSRFLFFICSIFLFFSCEETLFETDISEENVQLLAPSNGSVLEFTSINFNWNPIEQANQYQLQVATPNFDNPIQIVADVILDSLTEYDLQLNPNFYQWRVKAINSAYETSFSTAGFEVQNNDNFSNNTISLLAPDDNLITNVSVFTLEWGAVQEAIQYKVQIIDNVNQQVIDEVTTANTSLEYTFEEGSFIWQVRAERDLQFTLFSSRNILIDTSTPNTPNLLTPKDSSTLTDGNVTFTWDRVLIEGSVEIDSLYIYQDQNLTMLIDKQQVTNNFQTTLANNTYYWLMRAFDEATNKSEDSSIFSFTVDQ
ncbi:MAG: hypothetical protein JKY22_11170 [Flavobacteriaceae bacterium]|nr:hypothetical protein [Flavobacteriaceae bacterium]